MPAAVTPAGVRNGEPGALAGLCAARGPSVLAYCRQLAGDADAGAAAADAFARFRAAVVATDELSTLDPEALLLDATRNAAAIRAARSLPEACAEVPALLGARANGTIAIGDLERLEQHLQECPTCHAPVARFAAAERAYRDPPERAMDPAVVAEIVAAMADAVPARAAKPASSANGHGDVAPSPPARGPDAAAPAAGAAVDGARTTAESTTEFRPVDAIAVQPAPAPRRAPRRARRTPRVAGGTRLPRAERPAAPTAPVAPAGSVHSREPSGRLRRLPMFLPIAVVLAALLGALLVSGVVGGGDPASSPRVDVPADAPAGGARDDEPADVVVVPGAEEASAEDVERAKARDRERERARRRREAAAIEPANAAVPPPAAAAAPAVVAPPPPPPPAAPTRERRSDSGSGRRIEPRNGATGAEQIPPAEDTSTVPELAPAPETAPAP